MKSPLDLSFRYKVPLWGSVLIIAATFAVSAALMLQAYEDLKADLLNSSESLGSTLAKTLFPILLHDEVWRAFEIVRAPLHDTQGDVMQPEAIFVVDHRQRVFVSSHPTATRLSAQLEQLGGEYLGLARRISAQPAADKAIVRYSSAERVFVALPISEEGAHLGWLVIVHAKDALFPRFLSVSKRAALIGGLVLAVLLPINWYWGQRTAVPLVQLAQRIGDVTRGVPVAPAGGDYPRRDELGGLFEAFGTMVKALEEKAALEQEMIRSERLAAIGRLSAGLAHEINNPLGGMLVSLDNFKRRGGHDERTLKTIAVMERGLCQIRDTVSAVLVEAKVRSRDFGPQDVEDLQTLLAAEAHRRGVRIEVESEVHAPVTLPATLVRQILMNLLLNAVQASEPSGIVRCALRCPQRSLVMETENGGPAIPPDVMSHLFEPFATGTEIGHGLGLWVTYQIVSQLGGRIAAESRDGTTRFFVSLPLGESTCSSTEHYASA